jgi:hypothetical protein
MTSLSLGTTSSSVTTTFSPSIQYSPRPSTEEKSVQGTQGIGNDDSSISSSNNTDTPVITLTNNNSNATQNLSFPKPDLSSVGTSSTKSKGTDPEPECTRFSSVSDVTIPMIISTIFQRFLVRMPHTFIAMTMVFVPLYYAFNLESLAISATTFVGVGGSVYCFVRAFFLETIPQWMLMRNNENRKWRHLMNITYTGFITMMFTSAVWKLPDLSAVQGLAFLAGSFVLPYPFLAKFYPDIDKTPNSLERKYDIKL